jgi:hypothetical protein
VAEASSNATDHSSALALNSSTELSDSSSVTRTCRGAGPTVAWSADLDRDRLRHLPRSVPRVPAGHDLGSLIYIVGYTMLGYFPGPAVLGLFEALHLPIGLLGSGVPLLLLLGGLILVRRGLPHPLPRPSLRAWQRLRVGLIAGLLASFGALWTLDLMVVVAGDLAWRLPDSLPAVAAAQLAQALTRDATGGLLWLVMPLLAGVGWGAVYAAWCEPRLPGRDAARGVLFAFVPYLVSGGLLALLLVQVTDPTHVAPVALFAEAVRQAFFGLILGLAYPVLRARHPANRVLEPPLAARRSDARPAQIASPSG